ncbi:hypothetical protein [Saccharopolyspora thermophila]|uniref:hypothetical protein n=1 Tax=Saccharopolyspora thermophila TaxID=89367 RepID=UPI001662BF38|nr:hypothetical protein [Saccharopolyspora subtropica]
MADHEESPEHGGQRRRDAEAEPNLPANRDVVDAEVVSSEVTAAAPRPTADDEEYRQYQQFLEFQRFKEWQRAQGGGNVAASPPPAPAPPAPAPKKPAWKRALGLLRYKLVRRLIYLLFAVLLAMYLFNALVNSFFGGSGGSGGTGTGTGALDATPMKATTPQDAVLDVYNLLRGDDPAAACAYFDTAGRSYFAAAHQAPDCATAAQQLHARITDRNAYANPRLGENAVYGDLSQPQVLVLHCRVQVAGGPQLGTFKLTRQPDGGWAITGYGFRTSSCS